MLKSFGVVWLGGWFWGFGPGLDKRVRVGAKGYCVRARGYNRSYRVEPEAIMEEPEAMTGVRGGARGYGVRARGYGV